MNHLDNKKHSFSFFINKWIGRLFHRIHKYLEALSFIAIIFGVPLFFYQQWQNTEIRRTEETLRFVNLFQQERIASARAELLLPWFKYTSEIQRINNSNGLERSMLNRWVEKMIEASAHSNPEKNLIHSIIIITDFFDQLYLCINIKVCQEESAKLYFREYSSKFYSLYGHKIEELSSSLSISTFGRGIKYFGEYNQDSL